MAAAEAERLCLTDLPGELLELILCCDVLGAADIGRVACTCRRLREACQPRGKVWRERFRLRWAARGGGRGASGGPCRRGGPRTAACGPRGARRGTPRGFVVLRRGPRGWFAASELGSPRRPLWDAV